MTDESLRLERSGPVARLIFQRPERLNALTLDVQAAVIDAAGVLAGDDSLRVVIVGGDGGTFTAGADLGMLEKLHDGDIDPDHADIGRRMIDAVEAIGAVTIARIVGHCVGGGVVLAAACDLRFAAEDTYFSIPEVDLGIPLAWGAVPRLVRAIGPARTLELVATCRPFTAQEGAAMGFLNRVVARADLARIVEETADLLAAKPDYALKSVTKSVRRAAESLAPATGMISDADMVLAASKDEEGAAAALAYIERFRRIRQG